MSYYEPYEQPEPNYPEVEEIIDEATNKFDKILHDMFQSQYDEIKLRSEELERKSRQLSEKDLQLRQQEVSLEQRQELLQRDEEKQYQKFKQNWFHTLGLDLDIGDIVYFYKTNSQNIDCPRCHGLKKVRAKYFSNDEEFTIDCPLCQGWGKVKGETEYEVIKGTVSQIDIKLVKKENRSVELEHDYYGEPESCAYVNTRIGSKRVEARNLFKSREEVNKAIEEAKKKEREKKEVAAS